jgi:hypothetical protein
MSATEPGDQNMGSGTAISSESGSPGHVVAEVAALAKTISQQPDKASQSNICGVCNDHESKYKCTRCALP